MSQTDKPRGFRPSRHPDAKLLATFEEWKHASVMAEALSDDLPEDQQERCWEMVFQTRQRLAALPARTPQGAAVKVRYLFATLGDRIECYNECHRILWSLIKELEDMENARGTTNIAAPEA
ncbi:hypothetical protein M2352_004595 [Azospirillum fermentarium]|uniref:hypothetical protein n=1 Tax=Azospirillum fermentarium TaxID=1233114 RepID=UPI002227A149|nr:hypothetical protein [Azospirillum fermentarium]MCW2248935.1 hypothetical protein [Azospirillum fermentarium]